MKKSIVMTIAIVFCLTSWGFAEQAPQKVVDLANGTLAQLGMDATIVAAVKAANTRGQSLDDIKAMDKKWQATAGVADFMKALMESDIGQYLRKVQEGAEYYAEIFVMDNQGANVAMTDKTSDYWQGDEGKFKNSFKDGAGAVFVDEVEFDDSAQAYLVQVSVPVMDGGKAIGAITFGIDVDKIE